MSDCSLLSCHRTVIDAFEAPICRPLRVATLHSCCVQSQNHHVDHSPCCIWNLVGGAPREFALCLLGRALGTAEVARPTVSGAYHTRTSLLRIRAVSRDCACPRVVRTLGCQPRKTQTRSASLQTCCARLALPRPETLEPAINAALRPGSVLEVTL